MILILPLWQSISGFAFLPSVWMPRAKFIFSCNGSQLVPHPLYTPLILIFFINESAERVRDSSHNLPLILLGRRPEKINPKAITGQTLSLGGFLSLTFFSQPLKSSCVTAQVLLAVFSKWPVGLLALGYIRPHWQCIWVLFSSLAGLVHLESQSTRWTIWTFLVIKIHWNIFFSFVIYVTIKFWVLFGNHLHYRFNTWKYCAECPEGFSLIPHNTTSRSGYALAWWGACGSQRSAPTVIGLPWGRKQDGT